MTGVSLAGTQLRVNQYNMHDAEWNDVKVSGAVFYQKLLIIIQKLMLNRMQ